MRKALGNLSEKLKAFGWEVIEIDGHDFEQIYSAIQKAKSLDAPVAIVANTVKGKGVSFMENNHKWHGGGIGEADLKRALEDVER